MPTAITTAPVAKPENLTASPTQGIPTFLYLVTLASVCTVLGFMWDISWHGTIGRDGLFSPPHLLIYLGAVLAGLSSGIQVLWSSFAAPRSSRHAQVRIWGLFHGSLGALFCIWGGLAMMVSTVFDDWWHSAYGLDILILSPPHALLGTGALCLQFGCCVCICKHLNAPACPLPGTAIRKRLLALRLLYVLAAGSFLAELSMWATDFLDKRYQHNAFFYESANMLLLFLPALGSPLRTRHGCTILATGYCLLVALTNWVLQLFPATPLLGPILTHLSHLQPLQFPLLLFVPALAMDAMLQRTGMGIWKKALLLSAAFTLLLFLVQYPFSSFLFQSESARNWFFGSHAWAYNIPPDWEYRYAYLPGNESTAPELAMGLFIAIASGTVVARLSLGLGNWMRRVRR